MERSNEEVRGLRKIKAGLATGAVVLAAEVGLIVLDVQDKVDVGILAHAGFFIAGLGLTASALAYLREARQENPPNSYLPEA
jgi:hypothetical protein